MANLRTRTKIAPLPLIFGLLLVGSMVFGGYYFRQYQSLKSASSKTPEEQNKDLVALINKVYELPKDEEPGLVAKVKDEAIFKKDYPVFVNARVGDDLLLYEKSQLAVLYRSSENKVIHTAQINFKQGASVQIIAPGALQNSTEQTLTAKLSADVKVSGKSEPVGQYSSTTVVDVTGGNPDLAKKIAEALGGTVATTLPAGEKASEGVELVVIVANVATVEPTPAP